jgi:DNA-binding NarL/FixJ family response regulator
MEKKTPYKIRIMVAEDEGLIQYSIIHLLEQVDEFEVCGSARNGEELMELLKDCRPDIILLDLKMPKVDGFEVTRLIDDKMPWVKIIALTSFTHPHFIREIMRAGARGFLSKNCSFEELCIAIRTVYNGSTYLCKIASQVVMNDFTSSTRDETVDLRFLTPREIQLIRLLAEGYHTREIAPKLYISEKTVERHKSNILRKLKVKNTAHLIRVVLEKGLILT